MNKRRVILLLILIFVISLLAFFAISFIIKTKEKRAIADQLITIPSFNFTTLKGTAFSKTDLKGNLNTVFIFFNSECDFCQHEAQSISDNLLELKDMQILFVSFESREIINDFSKTYNLNNNPHITFLNDSTQSFSSEFGVNSFPYIFIYGKDQMLIKKHKGQLNAQVIIKTLKNYNNVQKK